MSSEITVKKVSVAAFWAVLVLLALSNAFLIKQNLGMRAELNKFRPEVLEAGAKAVPFVAPGSHGEMFTVAFEGRGPKRVFLYFSPDCPYCASQFPYWRGLLDKADRDKFEIMGLVSDSTEKQKVVDYLHGFACDHLETAFVSNSVLRNYKLSVTPTTLIVGSDGKVEQDWVGVWDVNILASARSVFGFPFESN